MKQIRETISVAVTGTSHTSVYTNQHARGIVKYAVLKVPTYTNDVTTTLSIVDQYSQTIYTASAVNRTTTTVVVLPNSATSTTSPFPIEAGYTITLTTSNVTGGATAYDVYLTLWIEDES